MVIGELLLLSLVLIRAKPREAAVLYRPCPSICPTMRDLCVAPAKKQGLPPAAGAFSPPHKARISCATAIGRSTDQVPRAPARFVRRRRGISDLPLAFRMQTKASEDGISSCQHSTPTCVSCLREYVSWASKEAGKPCDDGNDMTGDD